MSTTAGICMVKDEVDIIEHTIRHMLTQVDYIYVLDNGSTDGTSDVLAQFDIDVQRDDEVGYYQSRKMSVLAQRAAVGVGADWVVPFDADELWYSPFGRIQDVLAGLSDDVAVASAALYNHIATGLDPDDKESPFETMIYRLPDPGELPKVAARTNLPVVIEQGNHGAHYSPPNMVDGQLIVRHFPYRSPEHMIRKARNGAAAYAATDLPDHIGEHWRSYGRMSDEDLTAWFYAHFWHDEPVLAGLAYDPAMEAVRAARA